MTPERLRQIRDLFEAAMEHPPEARTAFIEGSTGEDEDLRIAVQRMLVADAYEAGMLDKPRWRHLDQQHTGQEHR